MRSAACKYSRYLGALQAEMIFVHVLSVAYILLHAEDHRM